MNMTLAVSLVLVIAAAACFGAPEGLVAEWNFDEGKGDVVNDLVGEADGTIHGARWVPLGDGHALHFDGENDCVDFGDRPSLSPAHAITVEMWVYPEHAPGHGEAPIFGKDFSNYLITYYGGESVWWYTGASTSNAKGSMPAGMWHHLAATYDGGVLALYVDGQMVDQNPQADGQVPSGFKCYIGTSTGGAFRGDDRRDESV